MKKGLLLFAAVLLTAGGAFAQAKFERVKNAKMAPLAQRIDEIAAQPQLQRGAKAPKRSIETGLYYKRPSGTMYIGFGKDGSGYGFSGLVANPFYPTLFVDQSKTAATNQWHGNYFNSTTQAFAGQDDFTPYVEDGMLVYTNEIGYWLAVPTIVNGTDSFALSQIPYNSQTGEGNYYWTQKASYYTRYIADSIDAHSFIDDHCSNTYYWGEFVPKKSVVRSGKEYNYLFGTGKYTSKRSGSTYISKGVMQVFEKPQTPLYVEDVFIKAASFDANPIADGKSIQMTIANVEWNEEDSIYYPGQKIFARMTCTANDITGMQSEEFGSNGEPIYQFVLNFADKQIDELGSETINGFAIDDKFCVTITGFDQEGVDINLPGAEPVASEMLEETYCIFSIEGKEGTGIDRWYGGINLDIKFTSCFDYCEPMTNVKLNDGTQISDFHVLNVSADGQTVTNKGYDQISFTQISTAFSWFDENEEENYILLDKDENDLPDWVQFGVQEAEPDQNGVRSGTVMVGVECQPLPAGTKGRYVAAYLYGRGYKSEMPILVVQGDVDLTGINNVASAKKNANDKTFSLDGRMANDNFKGIVIKNGKKTINK